MNKNYFTDTRGAIIELLLILVVAVILLVGVLVYGGRNTPPTDSGDGTPIVDESESPTPTGFGTISDPIQIPTSFPTESTLNTNSGDATLNNAASDINQLIAELNGLDSIENDVNLPTVDFSISF